MASVKVRGGGQFDGAQLENAATEETLQRLVDLMEKQHPGAGGRVRSAHREAARQGLSPRDLREANDGLRNVGRSSTESSGFLSSFAKGLGNIITLGLLPAFEFALKTTVDTISQSMDVLRDTSNVGASFNGSLLELNKSAAASGMSLDTFKDFVGKNASAMASLSGTVTEGAKRMGRLSKDLRESPAGQQMMALGHSAEDLNNGLSSYIELQSSLGNLQKKNDAQIRAGAGEYLKQLQELSRLTGESVDELAKKQAAELRDARVAAIVTRMGTDQQDNFLASMRDINATAPDLANALKDSIIGLGENPMANQLNGFSSAFRELTEGLKKGTLDEKRRGELMNQVGKDIQKKTSGMSAAAQMAAEGYSSLSKTQLEIQKRQKSAEAEARENAKEENKNYAAFSKALQTAKDGTERFFAAIKTKFLESDLFKKITDGVERFAKWLEGILPKADEKFDLDTIMGRIIENLPESIQAIAKDLYSKGKVAVDEISKTLTDLFSGRTDFKTTVTKVWDGLQRWFSGVFGGESGGGESSIMESVKKTVNDTWNNIKSFFGELLGFTTGDIVESIKTSVKGFFTSIKKTFDDLLTDMFGTASFTEIKELAIKKYEEYKKMFLDFVDQLIVSISGSEVATFINDLKANFQKAKETFIQIKDFFVMIYDGLSIIVPALVNGAKGAIDILKGIGSAFSALLDGDFNGVSSGLKKAIEGANAVLLNTVKILDTVFPGFAEGFDKFANFLANIGNYVKLAISKIPGAKYLGFDEAKINTDIKNQKENKTEGMYANTPATATPNPGQIAARVAEAHATPAAQAAAQAVQTTPAAPPTPAAIDLNKMIDEQTSVLKNSLDKQTQLNILVQKLYDLTNELHETQIDQLRYAAGKLDAIRTSY